MQVGRTLFMVWAVRRERPELTRNFQRVSVWLVAITPLGLAAAVMAILVVVATWETLSLRAAAAPRAPAGPATRATRSR